MKVFDRFCVHTRRRIGELEVNATRYITPSSIEAKYVAVT